MVLVGISWAYVGVNEVYVVLVCTNVLVGISWVYVGVNEVYVGVYGGVGGYCWELGGRTWAAMRCTWVMAMLHVGVGDGVCGIGGN